MSSVEHARNMLVLALHDITALKGMLDAETFTDGIFGFHTQQAVEKSLKAWITIIGGNYPFVHDIAELIEVLKEMKCPVEGLDEYLDYNAFAVQFRYSLYDHEEEPLDRPEIICKVQQLYDKVKKIIEELEPNEGE